MTGFVIFLVAVSVWGTTWVLALDRIYGRDLERAAARVHSTSRGGAM